MEIEILTAESLGVRGLCCFIKSGDKKILIDPGISLGYRRHGLLPHPFQVSADEQIQKKIIERWNESTDIIMSHFHGDHIPLKDANPYQLSLKKVKDKSDANFWCKGVNSLSQVMLKRYNDLSEVFKLENAQGRSFSVFNFSTPVPHGEAGDDSNTVMMTAIREGNFTFVHASDIQLLNNKAVDIILSWSPDIVLADGPPLYLSEMFDSSKHGADAAKRLKTAWQNAEKLANNVDILIIDHHLMRNFEGIKWLKRLNGQGKKVMCAADFMKKPRMLLEARRTELYKKMPIPEGWHKDYTRGKVSTEPYKIKASKIYKER
ncbi:MAG: MBL fold metallo-hydrolase [Elusimicrobiota bacterium]|nr:MBL fold metallo-hydrolase [Elusimicrobiota bacterium]